MHTALASKNLFVISFNGISPRLTTELLAYYAAHKALG
jgi:hypothetical protein